MQAGGEEERSTEWRWEREIGIGKREENKLHLPAAQLFVWHYQENKQVVPTCKFFHIDS